MEETRKNEFKSHTGFQVNGWEYNGKMLWSLGGSPKPEYRFREYTCAYDVEEMLIEKIGKVKGMSTDSEYCMLCIYFKDKRSALAYLQKIEKYLDKMKAMV